VLVVQVFSWLGPREPKSVCWDHFLHPQEEIERGGPQVFGDFRKYPFHFAGLNIKAKTNMTRFCHVASMFQYQSTPFQKMSPTFFAGPHTLWISADDQITPRR
jgi:hypothetical protein